MNFSLFPSFSEGNKRTAHGLFTDTSIIIAFIGAMSRYFNYFFHFLFFAQIIFGLFVDFGKVWWCGTHICLRL